jgi:hypothetical protein
MIVMGTSIVELKIEDDNDLWVLGYLWAVIDQNELLSKKIIGKTWSVKP